MPVRYPIVHPFCTMAPEETRWFFPKKGDTSGQSYPAFLGYPGFPGQGFDRALLPGTRLVQQTRWSDRCTEDGPGVPGWVEGVLPGPGYHLLGTPCSYTTVTDTTLLLHHRVHQAALPT